MANPPPKEEEEAEDWLVTYADAITLLMAFFVMLVSFSKVDISMFEKVAAGIKNEIGMGKQHSSPTEDFKKRLEDAVYEMQADQVVHVKATSKGIEIELASGAFFKPGTAQINPEAHDLLAQMGDSLATPRFRLYMIDVEGHTDDDPISTPMFPSNWELSSARASAVVRFLIDRKIDSERIKASAFAETRPKVPNRDEEGAAIPENQAENRRVTINVSPLEWDQRLAMLKKMEAEAMAKRRAEQRGEGGEEEMFAPKPGAEEGSDAFGASEENPAFQPN